MASLFNTGNVELTVASGDRLEVREVTVHERMSALFEIALVVLCENPDVDLAAVVGHPARCTVRGGRRPRVWAGICDEMHQVAVERGGRSTYHVTLAPTLRLAAQRRGYRIFQQASELDIALELLAAWDVEPEKNLTQTYEKRACRVQYDETDFAFVSRMLEEAGISFYFEQRGDESKLVLSDAPEANEERPPIPFRDGAVHADHEVVTSVRVGRRIRPGKHAHLASGAGTIELDTNALDLAPGVVTSLRGHPRTDLGPGKPLLVVASTLTGRRDQEWTHHVEARSASVPYRPPLSTPKPRVSGVESATVVGPAEQEVHSDELGRVRVQFHWDGESKRDERSSCWLHVSQPWGSARRGAQHLPRVGQEVIVDFLGGDPDRPIITGHVYTDLEKAPHALPDDPSIIGLDYTRTVSHDEDLTVGHDRSRKVGNDERTLIGKNQRTVVGVNRSAQVGATDATDVGSLHRVTMSDGTGTAMGPDRIELATAGGARITLEGSTVTLEAKTILVVAGESLSAVSFDRATFGGAKSAQLASASGPVDVSAGAGAEVTLLPPLPSGRGGPGG